MNDKKVIPDENKILISYKEVAVLALAIFLIIIMRYVYENYLLFHSIVELLSIIIAGGIFFIGWNSRKYSKSSFFFIIGISYLFIGTIDMLHTLSYSGMNIFIGYDANLPTCLWIAARYLQAISILAALLLLNRKINHQMSIIVFLLITILLIVIIFIEVFPACYITNIGLTPFKIISEYIIIVILFISIILMYNKREEFEKSVFNLMIISILCTIGAEIAFTMYSDVDELQNLIGHVLKIIAFYFSYKAIIQIGFERPYDLLFHQLRERELELSNIIEHSEAGILMIKRDGEYLLVNDKVAQQLGGVPNDFIGKSIYEIQPEEIANKELKIYHDLINGEKTRTYEKTLDLPSGDKTLYITEQAIKDIKGKYNSILQISTDITKRKRAEKRLERFVSTVSHELRTPITVLMMSIEYLMKSYELATPEIREKLFDNLSRNINLLNELVEDILMISKIDENKIMIKWDKYNLSEIIQNNLNMLEIQEKAKNLSIDINVDENLTLFGDIKRIDQIFRIFIENAIKYSKKQSKITILTKDKYRGDYNPDDKEGVLVQFIDKGMGIRKKDLPRISERFFRTYDARDIPGSGLGLNIAKTLLNLHGGKMFIDSEFGKGTSISIFLPRKEKP